MQRTTLFRTATRLRPGGSRPGNCPNPGRILTRSLQTQKSEANPNTKYRNASEKPAVVQLKIPAWVLILLAAVGTGVPAYSYLWAPRQAPSVSFAARSTAPLGTFEQPQYNLSDANVRAAQDEFVQLLGADGVNENLGTRIAHSSTGWSPAPRGDLDRPCLIVYPRTTEEVSEVAKICHRRRIPMIGFGGGTSLEGTLAAIHGEVCIDFKNMDRILALHDRDMDVVVQPGLGYEDLNKMLASKNLFFPPDPGPGAQIGGMISQGCSGTNAYRYGTVKDWVIGLTVVLADGTVIKTRLRPRKSSAGYDMTRLIVGSEGTLGFVTEAVLKVTNKPENVRVAVVSFLSTQAAVDTAIKIVQRGLPVAALELLDAPSMRAINNGGYCEKEFAEGPCLFLKFSGTKSGVSEQMKQVQTLARETRCTSFVFSQNETEADALWQARKTMLWSLMTLKKDPDDKFIGTDLAVPISRLGDVIEVTNAKLIESGLVGACCGHVGDGNFHSAIFYNEETEKAKALQLVSDIEKLGIQLEGTVTGEHGIGLEKRDSLVEELGIDSVDAMRKVKLALDPLCLLNPDKVMRLKARDTPI